MFDKMNLNTRVIIPALIFVGILSVGLISYGQIQQTNAQSTGFPGLDKIPGLDIFNKFVGEHNSNNNGPPNSNADYLDIDKAVVGTDAKKVQAVLQAHGHIPKDGSGGAFGYGILTTKDISAVMVSTTHKGVLDSKEQKNKNDPVWHNHYVSLGEDTKNCGSNPAVTSITYQSPGQVLVSKDKAIMSNLPAKFTGTNALDNKPLTLNPGTNIKNVVSFKLQPVFESDAPDAKLLAVCVTDIHPADKVIKN